MSSRIVDQFGSSYVTKNEVLQFVYRHRVRIGARRIVNEAGTSDVTKN